MAAYPGFVCLDITTWVVAARLGVVEGSLSRQCGFDITAWVVVALPAAAAFWRYVRNLWISEPQFRKMSLHLWHQGDTFQQVQW